MSESPAERVTFFTDCVMVTSVVFTLVTFAILSPARICVVALYDPVAGAAPAVAIAFAEDALIPVEKIKEELPYKCVLALCQDSDAPKIAVTKVTSLKVLTTSV